MPPATIDLRVAGANGLVGQHDGFQSRAAHLVDRQRRDRVGQTAVEGRLPRGAWPKSGGQHVAHDHFVNRVSRQARTADRFGHGHRAQTRSRHAGQNTQQFADGSAATGDNIGSAHGSIIGNRDSRSTKPEHAARTAIGRA